MKCHVTVEIHKVRTQTATIICTYYVHTACKTHTNTSPKSNNIRTVHEVIIQGVGSTYSVQVLFDFSGDRSTPHLAQSESFDFPKIPIPKLPKPKLKLKHAVHVTTT
jgi:hypothetical protein